MLELLFFVYGITIGSFLNVLIYRLPRKEDFVMTRSHCMQCGYQLRWYDLVPLLSWVQLGGRCRSCKTKISIQYPLIELLNGAAYLGIYLYLGLSWWAILACGVFSVLLVIFIIDLRHMEIPNGLVAVLLVIGVIWTYDSGDYRSHIIGFFAVPLFLLLLGAIAGQGMGMGDVKLMAASGLILGWQGNILALMIGAILGSVIGIGLLLAGAIERKQKIPFGPFLAIGIMTALLFGERLIGWYLTAVL